MNSFKFLDKPAPKRLAIGNAQAVEELIAREEHFRGVVKEVKELVRGWRETNQVPELLKVGGEVPKNAHLERLEELLRVSLGE